MSYYEMNRAGELVPYTSPTEWEEGEEEGVYLKRAGYGERPSSILGEDGDRDCLRVFDRLPGGTAPHEYLAMWSDAHQAKVVLVPDWPALMKLRALVAVTLATSVRSYLSGTPRGDARTWRPIAEAPRDGTPILGLCWGGQPRRPFHVVAWWDYKAPPPSYCRGLGRPVGEVGGNWAAVGDTFGYELTHYVPIPPVSFRPPGEASVHDEPERGYMGYGRGDG